MNTVLENKLKELEITQKEYWNVPTQTGNFLSMLIKMNNSQSVLEIGTSNGYSGLWLLEGLKQTGGHLTTIEFYEKRQSVAIENFNECGFGGMYKAIQGDACEILNGLSSNEKFDFVFIDANKREYIKYFEIIKPHLHPRAIICADNVNSHREKVQPFLDKVFSDPDFQSEILDLPGGLSVSFMKN